MSDDFKRYIAQNRSELDAEQPDSKLWNKIQDHINGTSFQPNKSTLYWKVAATILMITTLSLTAILFNQNEQKYDVEANLTLSDLGPEFASMETQYKLEIEEMMQSLEQDKEVLRQLEWLVKELDALESVNEELKSDIPNHQEKEKLVQGLIDYYEKKLKLLNRIELEIKRIKNEKQNETIT